VKRFFYYVRVYLMIISQNIKARMEYRVDFLIGFVGMIFWNIAGLLSLWVLFKTIPALVGWSYCVLVFMYGFTIRALTPYELFFWNLNNLEFDLITGSFIRYYFRPLNMMFYYISNAFDVKGFGQLALGIAIIVFASLNLNIRWDIAKVILFAVMYVSASLIIISFMLIAACSGFWIINSYSIISLAYKLRDVARYPLDIFGSVFKFIFTYIIPVGFVSYYPLQMLFDKEALNPIVFLSPVIAIVLFAITNMVWKKGVNSYTGTGT
jgi:ABC-2 type transport system permease protein